jgi:hypothetical protein
MTRKYSEKEFEDEVGPGKSRQRSQEGQQDRIDSASTAQQRQNDSSAQRPVSLRTPLWALKVPPDARRCCERSLTYCRSERCQMPHKHGRGSGSSDRNIRSTFTVAAYS